MHANTHQSLRHIPIVQEAEDILKACVHCGFCNAVCPTYQLLGDELDGPRGRIYQIKNLLEDGDISAASVTHLDRCLSCRSCESTCPSGVKYGRLLDIGRGLIAEKIKPPMINRITSLTLRALIPHQKLFTGLLRLGQFFKPVLPKVFARHIPIKHPPVSENYKCRGDVFEKSAHVLLLRGCVQASVTPQVNEAIEVLLQKNQVNVHYLSDESCCGALDYHLSAQESAKEKIKHQVDALYQQLFEQQPAIDFIISSASGCGVTIKSYPEILQYEVEWKDKAEAVAAKVVDVVEYLQEFNFRCGDERIAIHTPCTLQHGQKLPNAIENLFRSAGAKLVETNEKHLCCGAAGAYSLMQPKISAALTQQKIKALSIQDPDIILTANIGCQISLENNSKIPVMHWVEYLAKH